MAKDKVIFSSGYEENLPQVIVNGKIYFVIADNGTGKILFDKDDKRYVVADSSNESNFLTKPFYKIGSQKIYTNDLVALDKDGLIVPAARSSFLLNSPLYIANSAHPANETGNVASFYDHHYNIAIKNMGEELNGIQYKPLYLKGKIFDGLFKPSSNSYVYSLPTEQDFYCYLYIGEINSYTSKNGNYTYINFNTNHPIYHFKDDEIQLYTPNAQVTVADKLSHTLTIGKYQFDGSKDVTVPIYSGETLY